MTALVTRAAIALCGLFVAALIYALVVGNIMPQFSGELAYASDRDGDFEIYRMDVDHRLSFPLTHNHEIDSQPIWSPDGSRIAFVSQRDGEPEIYVMDGDGSHLQSVTHHPASGFSPSWSPDGQSIAFTTEEFGVQEIMVVNMQDGRMQRLTQNDSLDATPDWSPDGTQIAFVSDRGRPADLDIYVMDSDGQNVRQVVSTPGQDVLPSWSPDGRLMYESDWGGFSIGLTSLNDGATTILLRGDYEAYGIPVWSADGHWLAVSFFIGDRASDIYVMDKSCTTQIGGCQTTMHPITSDPGMDAWPSWKP